jgi:GNAT superfamily N-acetyltransferase
MALNIATLRALSVTDLVLIRAHRRSMFLEAGKDIEAVTAMEPYFERWLSDNLENGTYFGFIAEINGSAIGGIGMMTVPWPPHPMHPTQATRAYVLNVYVDVAQRGQGVARKMMEAADAEFRARGLSYAILHATDAGRPLYERMGWAQTSEMAKLL